MNSGKIRTSLFLAALLTGVAGCASGGGAPAATSQAAGTASAPMPMESSSTMPSTAQGMPSSGAAITVKDFAFGEAVTVPPGAAVTVTNQDSADHTVTADQGEAFDAQVKGGGGTATFMAPTQPGTYAFHCTYHPNMHGTLTVK